jgi:NSS family neurotransmitter:Na+ symporter
MSQEAQRGNWGSRLGFILAATGSAIGLGNLWKFPYITYDNGGGAFVIIYLIAIAIIGLPIMVAELVAGKATQQSPWGAFKQLAKESESPLSKLPWALVGGIGILAGFIILSYYSVVAGWTIEYAIKGLTNQFSGQSASAMGKAFGQFVGNPYKQLGYHCLFMGATMGIVVMGVSKGIERATRLLMPILFVLIVIVMLYSASVGGFGKTLQFLFIPDFSKITGHGILEAVGHAFFTLSLGMGAMLTYGSYLRKTEDIAQPAIAITFFDTLIAMMACFMIYPIIFGGFGFKAGASIGLLFTSLPVVFAKMPMGTIIAPLFFVLVAFAALSSTISLLEVVVSFGVDEFKWNRKISTIALGGAIFVFGIPSALCNGASKYFTKLVILTKDGKGLNWLDSFDYLASNWLLPIGGLLTALFVGWVMDKRMVESQQDDNQWKPVVTISHLFLRYVSPIAVFVVLLNKVGVIDFKPKPTPKAKAKKSQKAPARRAPVRKVQAKKTKTAPTKGTKPAKTTTPPTKQAPKGTKPTNEPTKAPAKK